MKNSKGFSLIELLCTISILGILTLITVPLISGIIDKWVLNSSVNEIAGDIRWVQNLAITEATPYIFELDIKNALYKVRGTDARKAPLKTVKFDDKIDKITSTLKTEGNFKRLTYTPTGIPSQTGSIILTSKKGEKLKITIAVGTGRVAIVNEK